MLIPKSRKEFERSLNILLEMINGQRIQFVKSRRIAQSMMNARYLPNKRMNFHTVDEMLRLNANTANTMPLMIKNEKKSQHDKGA